MNDSAPLQFYEFFAGAGMARLGLAGQWKCVWANDIDPSKSLLYEHNFGPGHLDKRDIALVAEDVKAGRHAGADGKPAFPLGVDMAWASFPCQDLSLAGWQRGMTARRSGTYWHFHEIMHALGPLRRPPLVVIENVQGLLYGDSFRGLCESLRVLGMKFGALLVDAKHFVAQSRPRVFIIAVDQRVDTDGLVWTEPGPWHTKPVLAAHAALSEDLKAHWQWWRLPASASKPPIASELLEASPGDVDYHPASKTRRLLELMNERHRAKVEAAKGSPGVSVGFLYKRMRNGQQRAEVRFDGVAGCLRTPKGGSSRQTVVVVDDTNVRSRLLSRNEAARLMGIPLDDTGRLPGADKEFFPADYPYNDAYRAMGDGVAVPVVRHLGENLLTPLAERARALDHADVEDQLPLFEPKGDLLESVNSRIAEFFAREK